MNRSGMMLAVSVFFSVMWVHAQTTNATVRKPKNDEPRSAPEMQKLYDTLVGKWQVTETFEISTERQGKAREGTARFHPGPGPSLIEEYRSNGAAGNLRFMALFWWDQAGQIYRLLTCANDDGCQLRGTAGWDGRAFVNSWEEDVAGKRAKFKDSFVDLSPSSFRLVSEGTAEGKTIWRVITRYKRMQ